MAEKARFSTEALFAHFVISDLQRAKCRNEQLASIVRGTVDTTIAFIRNNRRTALARWALQSRLKGNPTALQLAEQEFRFEDALLASVTKLLPRQHKRGRKKDHKDPDTWKKFTRIWLQKKEGKTWREIAEALVPEFGHVTPGAYKKIYARHLPEVAKELRKLIPCDIPEQEFLRRALSAAKGRPGRPKSRQN